MGGGTVEHNLDSTPLATGTHDGSDASATLNHHGAMFKTFGVRTGVFCENETQSTSGLITAVTDTAVTVAGVTWDYGDTYNIYITATKDSKISSYVVDVSAGWRSDPKELVRGWRKEDLDLDDHGRYKVFGPGQPE